MNIHKRIGSLIFSLLLVFTLFCSTFTIQSSAATNPALSAENRSVKAGETFSVPVKISNSSAVYGGNFTLQYDSSLLSVEDYEFGSIVSGHTKNCNLDYQSAGNLIRVTFSGASALNADGTLVTFTFKAKASGSAKLQFNAYKMYDENGSALNTTVIDGKIDIEEKALSKIEIYELPKKTSYYLGDELDTTGLTLTATYTNGTTETVTEGFTCTPETLNTAGTQKIIVTYEGKTATFDVTVNNIEVAEIEIKTKPEKTTYYAGDKLDTTGLTLTATYNNGTTETVTEGFTCTPETLNTAGTQKITVTYEGKTATFDVKINDILITDFSIKTNPKKTSYFIGDKLDVTGLTLTATCNNGEIKTIIGGYTCTPEILDTVGTQKITVSLSGLTATFDVTVNAVEIESIEVSTNPKKTSYFIGDELDITGLTLTATYNNGTTETIDSGFDYKAETFDKAGTQKITVTYEGKTTTFNVTVNEVKISGIAIKTKPEKTTYYAGDELDTEGLTLTATYNNGTTETITEGFTCTPETLDTVGTQKITVTYVGKTTTFDVTVNKVEITGVEIKSNPTKTTYYTGESFSTEGLELLVSYNNGTTEIVTFGFSTTGFNSSTVGTKTIKVSYKGFSDTFTVTIIEKIVPVTGVTINKTSLSLYKYFTETLTATITPNNATDKSVTWSSSDTSVATVDDNGKVTGVNDGTAIITITTNDGNFTAECEVTVETRQVALICLHRNTTVHKAKKSTCLVQGNNEYTTCDDCDKVVEGSDEKLPLADHIGGTATCEEKAICFVCNKEYGEYAAHKLVNHPEKAADHANEGNIEYWSCNVCKKYFLDADDKNEITLSDTITGKVPHNYSNDWTNNNNQHWHECNCGDKIDTEIHIYESNCDNSCDICGYTRKVTHNWNNYWTNDAAGHWIECKECGIVKDESQHTGGTATCTDKALCSVCNAEYGKTDDTNHVGKTVIKNAVKATCTADGYSGDTYCKDCDKMIIAGNVISSTGHTSVKVPGKAPTATATGLTDGEKCSVCGEILKKQEIIPATGQQHTHNYKKVTTAPTCTDTGYTTYTCACGESYVDNYVAAKGHTPKTVKGTSATCTKAGSSDGAKCSVCGTVTKTQTTIPAKGHKFGNWVMVKAPTTSNKGTEERICSVCGAKETRSIEKLNYMLGDANADSKITAADARLVLRVSAKLETLSQNAFLASDVNKDKKITAADARTILRVSAKLETF